MTRSIADILALGFLVALLLNVLASRRTRDWTLFRMPLSTVARTIVYLYIVCSAVLALLQIVGHIDPIWFIGVFVGGQTAWQLYDAAAKVLKG